MTQTVDALYSALYDVTVTDWPGEIEFYRALALASPGQEVLEIACGTGRVTLQLARAGVRTTQTATVTTVWEEVGADGTVLARWERPPVALHCVFRYEMEHLLRRAGYTIEAVYGDFDSSALANDSDSMIWVALNHV